MPDFEVTNQRLSERLKPLLEHKRVPVMGGKTLTLNVPAGTQNGKVFRVTGQGMPKLRASTTRGDLYVTLEVLLPTRLSTKERELVEELREIRK